MAKKKGRTILLVDDEALFRKSLADGLERQEPRWRVLLAENAIEARALLEGGAVDLVLTDLAMPQSDGFELLAYMVEHRPWVPVLVLTAFGTDETRKRLGELGFGSFLEKPVDFDRLVDRIAAIFESEASGVLRGISLPTFLQILELDRKSCRVRVNAGVKSGRLDIVGGELHHAEAGQLQGEAAAMDILCWDGVELEASALEALPERTVGRPLRDLMLDSFRQRDERLAGRRSETDSREPRAGRSAARPAKSARADATKARKPPSDLPRLAEVAPSPEPPSAAFSLPGSPRQGQTEKENVMAALESYLEEFKGVKGYLASGIMDFTGETLAAHSADAGIHLEAVGAVFNDIFRGAHEASRKIGLDACNTMALTTPKGVIVMECSGVSKTPHLHVIVILQEGGNQALAKMTVAKIMPLVVKELS